MADLGNGLAISYWFYTQRVC